MGLLLKDIAFWGASLLFLGSLSTFLWGLAALRSSASPAPRVVAPALRDAAPAPSPSAPAASAPPPPSAPAAPPDRGQDLVVNALQDKFNDLSRKISALEQAKSQTPPYLDALLKRVSDMEAELKSLKGGFTQLAAAQNAVNINELTSKIKGIQKVLENLTSGTDVSKPS